MEQFIWSRLNHLQVGKYSEYFVKMEFTLHGFQVYCSEVDDRGIDLIARYERSSFLEIQVKSLRSTGYVFMPKKSFALRENLYLALVLLIEHQPPDLYLIPSDVWQSPGKVFVSHDYDGLKSLPEWGVNISRKNMPALQKYQFHVTVEKLLSDLGTTAFAASAAGPV